jgi:hypothetical protein
MLGKSEENRYICFRSGTPVLPDAPFPQVINETRIDSVQLVRVFLM